MLFHIQIDKNLIIGQNQMLSGMRSRGKTYTLLMGVKFVKIHFEKHLNFIEKLKINRTYFSSVLIIHSKDTFAHVNQEKCTRMPIAVLIFCNRKNLQHSAENKHLEENIEMKK